MSDNSPDFSKMARLLAEALDWPDWDRLSDSELERLLDSTASEPPAEPAHDHILQKAQHLIRQWEASTMATQPHAPDHDSMHQPPMTAGRLASSPGHSKPHPKRRSHRAGTGSAVVLAGILLLAVAVLFLNSRRDADVKDSPEDKPVAGVEFHPFEQLIPAAKPSPPVPARAGVGSTMTTKAFERKRISLPDGSVAYLNENTTVLVKARRRLKISAGEVFVEVVPRELTDSKTAFVVETPQRNITALGTKFAVKADKLETDVLVTQGKVKVSGIEEPLSAGQQLKKTERLPAPRASEALLWTKELMASAESPLIPKSEHAGGALVAVDPAGQEMQLSLRKQHIDVHIEDGFARTTIDQTYFNASWSQMEGTFYFPLPADASLSRLAMYVGENLMEGGMAERDHARNVFEQIRYTRRDPALLEWVDGSTFKMRVFPLEARQEKRIILSYTQRLPYAYGKVHYRFPAGHSLELVRDWSTQIRVKNHAGQTWNSPSHQLDSHAAGRGSSFGNHRHRRRR